MTTATPPAAPTATRPASSKKWRRLRRVVVVVVIAIVVVTGLVGATSGCFASFGAAPSGERLARLQRSPHHNGKTFENREVTSLMAEGQGGKNADFFFGDQMGTPNCPLPMADAAARRTTLSTPPPSGLRITWLGHSTTLIEIDGARVLSDPQFSEKASPTTLVGPTRFDPPPMSLEDLPAIDAVIVSHDHYDHLDMASVTWLHAHSQALFFVPLGIGAHLERWGVETARIRELDWDESFAVGPASVVDGADQPAPLTIISTPSRHFSGRTGLDANRTLWTSWVLKGPQHRVYFSGDTGLTPQFQTIGATHGPFDVAMLEIGQWDEAWGDIHLGPRGALEAFRMLDAKRLFPIHWGAFNLALHDWNEPIETLVTSADAAGVDVVTPTLGLPIEPDRAERTTWWRTLPPTTKQCP